MAFNIRATDLFVFTLNDSLSPLAQKTEQVRGQRGQRKENREKNEEEERKRMEGILFKHKYNQPETYQTCDVWNAKPNTRMFR